ncbi:MAG: RdgB/HAM1 family non-canonical purine NTP pyrophosphatase [Lachnospiraceae bacterium]|nr:RdgB/HAM1 family non-canonical purine NTP pyrophosphatase [Lachnospiraceae bacterium]
MDNKTIIFATGNMGKMREIRQILDGLPYDILSMKEAGLETDVDETGETFEENAILKARAIADKAKKKGIYCDAIVMADDSGFEVDHLGGRPGIYSARFMGTDTPYSIKNQKILEEMEGVPEEERTARFVAAIACVFPDGSCKVVRDTFEGLVAHEAKGIYGFGYDPIMYVPEKGCNSGELLPEEKNKISHRGKALMKVKELLENL